MNELPRLLLLFDVDGTLIEPTNSTGHVLLEVTNSYFGLENSEVPKVSFSGNTDLYNVKTFLEALKLAATEVDYHLPRVAKLFDKRSVELMSTKPIRPLKGVLDLLHTLSREESLLMGVLTGNSGARAKVKLARAGLDSFFRLGVYGSHHLSRCDLPKVAQDEVHLAQHILFSPARMVLIGDTPTDIYCAKRFGARSIAVATGDYSLGELSDLQPDMLLSDFTDTGTFLRNIKAFQHVML